LLGKSAVTQALESLIADDMLSEEEAREAARRIMGGNAKEVYRLERA
jgi:hypothetical protein